MASHAGLVYVLRTKKGYVGPNKAYVNEIKDAEQIVFERFGWCDLSRVLVKLGFEQEEVTSETITPSYDSRLGTIENLYVELGYTYREAMKMAYNDFESNSLYDSEKYKRFELNLRGEINKLNEETPTIETIEIKNGPLPLKEPIKKYKEVNEEYENQLLYSSKGYIYKTKINLKKIPFEKYFNFTEDEKRQILESYCNIGQLKEMLIDSINDQKFKLGQNFELLSLTIDEDSLTCYTTGSSRMNDILSSAVRDYYEKHAIHITRMFGSYILLVNESNNLKAIKATSIPIKYCPLMVKLLKEVGGRVAEDLLTTLAVDNEQLQTEMMCSLINDVVIKGGYFDTSRPLNSCEANVVFGASETIASAFDSHLVDAAVIVSNNLGTIITTNSSNTQGAVKRMTGLFYTSPSKELVDIAKKSHIIPVFPYTAKINQLAGVKKAIELGYKNIAVSVAADDNYLLEQLKTIETEANITLYKFGLCSTGISSETAKIMAENADVIWSCASKQVKEYVEPAAIAQVGIKIPVHIMTENGWKIVKSHLQHMNNDINFDGIKLISGNEEPIFMNEGNKIKVLTKKEVHNCFDCPHPCI